MSNSDEKLSNAFNIIYGTFNKEWYEFLEKSYEHLTSERFTFERDLRYHARFTRQSLKPLIYGKKKFKIRPSLFAQVFCLKKNRGIEKRILQTIEHIFGIFFSVYWEYSPCKFNKELNWEYLTEEKFEESFFNIEEKLNKKWQSLQEEVKRRTYYENKEVYEDGDYEEEKINEEYEKSIDLIYEKFCDYFLKIKEETVANSDDPIDEVVLIEFRTYFTRDQFKEYVEDIDNKLRNQWEALANFKTIPWNPHEYEEALNMYNTEMENIEQNGHGFSRNTNYIDNESFEDFLDEFVPKFFKKEDSI